MNTKDFKLVKLYYPTYFEDALKTSEKIQSFWGRDETEFYTTFGRKGVKDGQTCSVCAFD